MRNDVEQRPCVRKDHGSNVVTPLGGIGAGLYDVLGGGSDSLSVHKARVDFNEPAGE
ncbi:MAG: hypothetical protein KBE65_14975 [Phycisphaerae bacterium]|nr:hypothetical protein [Phycisphaerae bacterium]